MNDTVRIGNHNCLTVSHKAIGMILGLAPYKSTIHVKGTLATKMAVPVASGWKSHAAAYRSPYSVNQTR